LSDPNATDPIVRDEHGNATGVIRPTELESQTGTVNGTRNGVAQATPGAPNFCFLFGHTVPFDAATLVALYPSHAAFVAQFNQAADAIERAGFWLKPEADDAKKAAEASSIGGR